jgi:protocatechuate 3,4-dioxygenase beta subunit
MGYGGGVTATRRGFLGFGASLPLLALADPWLAARALAAGGALEATPACGSVETVAQAEGPFYSPRTPRRRSLLEPGLAGKRLVLTGTVATTRCKPVRGAVLDFWQADAAGEYDNEDYRLRGHQVTDARGRWRLETIVPGRYPGRTPHVHVRVKAPGRPLLTTQLYLAAFGSANAADQLFDRRLLVRSLRRRPAQWTARFDFVL